ncbi:MAG: YsnF/AvaK domain-containing protein [Kofleriaceae bacterium]
MPQTVVGFFNHLSEARTAETRLLESGFISSMVDVSPGNAARTASGDHGDGGDDDGSVKRFFKNLFGAEPDAERYAAVAESSEAVVTVHAATVEQAERAAEILDRAGSIDVDQHGAQHGVTGAGNDAESVKVIQENMQVGKRTVATGGARLRSRIVEREVSEDIRLKHERVLVRRRPVDRVASAEDLAAFREGQIELIEHAEVPVVAKEVRVVEEVSLKKEQGERTETVRDTVRSTEVEVEPIDSLPLVDFDRR